MKKVKLSPSIYGQKHALVDDEDFERLNASKWHVFKGMAGFYACRRLNKKVTYMHRYMLDVPKDKVVDHIDGDTLNNCRNNLRVCTNKENIRNSKIPITNKSGYKGVSKTDWGLPDKGKQKWRVRIQVDRKSIYLGTFYNVEEAGAVYNKAAKKYFGEFARLNNIK